MKLFKDQNDDEAGRTIVWGVIIGKTLLAAALLVGAGLALAQDQQPVRNVDVDKSIPVIRNQLGTGTPASVITVGIENARYVADNYYHVPQYMPNYPTAAVIWPRVIDLECERVEGQVRCNGYHWLPEMGRGEYLFVTPRIKEPVAPVIVTLPAPPPVIVYKEVKKKRE